jgi:hypothetical protein
MPTWLYRRSTRNLEPFEFETCFQQNRQLKHVVSDEEYDLDSAIRSLQEQVLAVHRDELNYVRPCSQKHAP